MKLDLCFPPRVDIQEDMKPVLIKNRVSLSFIGFSFAMKMPLIPYSLHLKGQSKVVLTFWYLFGKLSFLKNVNVYYWLIKEADLNSNLNFHFNWWILLVTFNFGVSVISWKIVKVPEWRYKSIQNPMIFTYGFLT